MTTADLCDLWDILETEALLRGETGAYERHEAARHWRKLREGEREPCWEERLHCACGRRWATPAERDAATDWCGVLLDHDGDRATRLHLRTCRECCSTLTAVREVLIVAADGTAEVSCDACGEGSWRVPVARLGERQLCPACECPETLRGAR